MTGWAPFLWLTAVVLVSLLALARVSSGVVRDGDGGTPDRPALDRSTPDRSQPDRPAPDRLGEPRQSDRAGTGAQARQADPWSPSPPAGTADSGAAKPVGTAVDPPEDALAPDPAPDGATVETRHPTRAGPDHVDLSWGMLLANVAITQGLVGLVLAAGVVWFDVPLSALGISTVPWVGGLPALGVGVAFGLVLWVGNEAAASAADAVGATYDEAVRGMLAPDSLRGWAILLGLALPTVAVVEELLFRAALIGVPAAATGVSPWLLAVGSSVAFALGHGAQGRVGVAVTGLLGLVLAAGFVLTGSLLVVVVAHYVVNATEFVVHEGLGFDRLW